jgi:hypothetical protein
MAVLEQQPRITLRRTAAVLTVLALVLYWIYIFVIATPDPGDRLADQTFPHAAEPICTATLAQLGRAGLVGKKANTPVERADLTDQADAELTTMIARLRAIAPTSGDAAAPVQKWLGDWDIWLKDRQDWSDKLRSTGRDQPFLETGRASAGGEPNSKELDSFADTANDMPDCATPEEV